MYKFGNIVTYEIKKGKNVPILVLSDDGFVINGLYFEKKNNKSNIEPSEYFKTNRAKTISKNYNQINLKKFVSLDISLVKPSNNELSFEERMILMRKLRRLISKNSTNKEFLERIISIGNDQYAGTKTDPYYLDSSMISMNDLFPSGTGRTKEEFEEDNKYIYKKYKLEYTNLIKKH